MPIFDQGYQHWKGELAGHGWRWLAITRHGIRVTLQNRFVRLLLLGALIPALALAAVISLWGMVEQKSTWAMRLLGGLGPFRELLDDPAPFRLTAWTICFHFFLQAEMFIIMFLVLLVGPSLVSQDLRYNALPLYFSRPVRRIDYFLGKLGVIGFFLGLVAVVPAVAAWLLGLLFSLDFRAVFDTFLLLLGLVFSGLIITLSAGLFILALSSLSRNSRYVAVFWAGMWFLTSAVSGVLQGIHYESVQRQSWNLINRVYDKHYKIQNLMNNGFDGGPGFIDDEPFEPDRPRSRPTKPPEPAPRNEQKLREEERKRRDAQIAQLKDEIQKLIEEIKGRQTAMEDALRDDWRPVISYTANLQRLSFALIGSRKAWEKVDELTGSRRTDERQRRHDPRHDHPLNDPVLRRPTMSLASMMVPQFPWYWSALVLLALGGVSVWILNKRVTSLDKLR